MVVLTKRRSNSIRRLDWTRDQGHTTEFQRATRDFTEWTTSPLGPMAEWPASLRQMVLVCMADTMASAVLWGPVAQTAIVYNEAFAAFLGNKHPKLQGQVLRDELADLCSELDTVWQRQAIDGITETVRNQRIRQDRLGFVEEKNYNWKFVPVIGDDGFVAGSLVTVEDESKLPPRRERSKSAVREFGNVVKGAIDRTANQTAVNILRLDGHFSGKACNCEKLWEATKLLEMHEARYEKFADFAPVGIASLDKNYELDWANKAYFDVMAQPEDAKSFFSFIHPEDVAMAQGYFDTGAFRDDAFTFECRLKKWGARPAISPSEAPRPVEPSPAWVLVSAYRENDVEQRTMCWIIDITAHKNAEDVLRRQMESAVEERETKERFIDQISHEVRNPLSAMLHCTDDIIESIQQKPTESSNDILEAAQTISYCTQHIKNIVGDVLTLSKLDSRLVEISPRPAQARELVQDALKIFTAELRAGNIQLNFELDPSMTKLELDWLMIDPGRMLQVLINLVTNAIKVVKDRSERRISVKLSAATTTLSQPEFQYVKPRQVGKPVEFGEAYSNSPSVFLYTTVEDTGPGLEQSELDSLFERFAQANPKTQSKYGGSGLGLFISRDLTELQGGRIGVASTPGVGSKFVFSVEVKRANALPAPVQTPPIEIPTRLLGSSTADSPVAAAPPTTMPSISEPSVAAQEPLRGPGIMRASEQPEKTAVCKVLVVEDNLVNQKVLAKQLRKRGFEVEVALHGEEALDKLNMTTPPPLPSPKLPSSISTASTDSLRPQLRPQLSTQTILRKPVPTAPPPASSDFHVVLMDIEMPVMDGITCAQQIRAFETSQGGHHRVPIIAVTANVRSEHGSAAIDAGMNAITTKPYKIEELVGQIEKCCEPAG